MPDILDFANYAITKEEALAVQREIGEDTGVMLPLGLTPGVGLPPGKAIWTLGTEPFNAPAKQLSDLKAGREGLWKYRGPSALPEFIPANKPATSKPNETGGSTGIGPDQTAFGTKLSQSDRSRDSLIRQAIALLNEALTAKQ